MWPIRSDPAVASVPFRHPRACFLCTFTCSLWGWKANSPRTRQHWAGRGQTNASLCSVRFLSRSPALSSMPAALSRGPLREGHNSTLRQPRVQRVCPQQMLISFKGVGADIAKPSSCSGQADSFQAQGLPSSQMHTALACFCSCTPGLRLLDVC